MYYMHQLAVISVVSQICWPSRLYAPLFASLARLAGARAGCMSHVRMRDQALQHSRRPLCVVATPLLTITQSAPAVMTQMASPLLATHTHPAFTVKRARCMPFHPARTNVARNARFTCKAAESREKSSPASDQTSRRSVLWAGASAAVTCIPLLLTIL